ncbi:GNAT family N-acetyltransferase [Cryptosporangium sp. NPDC048952]|uniref:GNAT family N-acetyltransferase n=1 Tax=Cryptosporangium sp. NPDC048952 TaxID=3363961 RepID=UPI0037150E11
MTYIRTYLEMTSAAELIPGRPAEGVALLPIGPELIRELETRVGEPHGWGAGRRTDEEWAAQFAKPYLHDWAITHHDEPVGIVELADRAPEVEITTFGLVPEAVGRGIGSYALTLAVRQAWDLLPTVSRVWLHTSTQDHPNALPNYQARGFKAYRTEEQP